jgi:hypothetical protein
MTKKLIFFMYIFLLTTLVGLSSFYLRENFQKSFNAFTIIDFTRIIMVGIVEIGSMLLLYDNHIRYKEIPPKTKTVLSLSAFVCTVIFFVLIIGTVYLK